MPRGTNFVLNPQQEDKLSTYLDQRHEALKQSNYEERIKLDQEAWRRYWLDVKLRKTEQGSIYPLSNLPLPVFAMTMEHFVSRCEDATTGDKPYFHFDAVGVSGEEKASLYNSYFNWKLDECGKVHESMLDAQLCNFIQKASILKAVYEKQEVAWVDLEKEILHDKATGKPIEIHGHGPIIKGEDQFMDQVDPAAVMAETPGQPAPTRKHLAADPSFVLDENQHQWAPAPAGLQRSEVIYAGPRSENVAYDRFLCPMDAESVDAADCVIELVDKRFDWIRDNWIERPWLKWADVEGQMKVGDVLPKDTTATRERPVETPVNDLLNPVRRVWECWVRRDVLGNGMMKPQEFVAYIDAGTKKLIYYEWVAKVCPDLKRPYTVVAIGKLPNRWFGKSLWERGKPIFEAVDRLFNGEYYRTLQQANPPKGGDPKAAVEEPDDVPFDPTKFWQMKSGKTIDDLFKVATIPDTNQRTQMVMEYIIFWIQLWLGISNLAQGDYAAVKANATNYGIEKTLSEASMLGRRFIRRVISGGEDHLLKLVQIALATLPENQMETFEFTDGDMRKFGELMTTEIRKLRIHVTIVMSQDNAAHDINRAQTALGAQAQYLNQMDPTVRKAVRPLILEVLTDLGYKNVEELLPEFAAMPVSASMGGEPGAAGAAAPQPNAVASDAPEPTPTPVDTAAAPSSA